MKPLTKYTLRIVALVGFVGILCHSSTGQEIYDPASSDWSASWDKCKGELSVRFLYYDETDCDDWIDFISIAFKNSSGNFQTYFILKQDRTNEIGTNGGNGEPIRSFPTQSKDFNYAGWGSYSFEDSDLSLSRETGNDRKYVTVVFKDLPENRLGISLDVRIRFKAQETGSGFCGGNTTDTESNTKSVTTTAISAPTSVSATTEEFCDKVRVSWTNPSLSGCTLSSSNTSYKIYRSVKDAGSFSLLGSVNHPTNSYDDTNASKGVEYDYYVRTLFEPNNKINDESPNSSEATGSIISALTAPTIGSASVDDCGDKIVINWSWTASTTNLGGFEIQRKQSSGSSWTTLSSSLSSSARSYEDTTVPLYETNYDYRLFSLNSCTTPDKSAPSSTTTGLKPDTAEPPTGLTSNIASDGITINWNYPITNNATGFIIERTFTGGGSALMITDLENDPSARSYTDNDVNQCVTYTYRVKALSLCSTSGVGDSTISGIISPDLSMAFATDGTGFRASKGYFTDKVELTWTNNNDPQTNQVKIFRRILGSGDPFALLTSENDDSGIYNDNNAEAGILYEYEIYAEGPCENSVTQSNSVRTIGFRSKTGIVTGNVSYEGGIAVEGAKIIAEGTGASTPISVQLDGSQILEIQDNASQSVTNEVVAEAWIKPTSSTGNFTIIGETGYELARINGSYRAWVFYDGGSFKQININQDSVPLNTWSHLAMQLRNDSLFFYINGKKMGSKFIKSGVILNTQNTGIELGEDFDGCMKEVRIWNQSKTDLEIERNVSRFATGDEPSLIVLLPLDEGLGAFAYDRSQSGPSIFNRNHADLDGAAWVSDAPTISQLSYASYTNDLGNYTIILPYTNAGTNYILTPTFKTHQFEPSTKVLFIGDGSTVQNGVDFTDVSAFPVTGSLFYDGSSCPVEGAFLKIDGVNVVQNGVAVTTDANGDFAITVPIGEHFISVEQAGHVYSAGRFPSTGLFDFQEPVSGIEFRDSTKFKVIGRVVGGNREAAKTPGFGKAKNNIGQAMIIFTSQLGSGCHVDTAMTDPVTGEYQIDLFPLKYQPFTRVSSNPLLDQYFDDISEVIDLSTISTPKMLTDTTTTGSGATVVNELTYHLQQDYIYKSQPEIIVVGRDGSSLIGDSTYTYTHPVTGVVTTRNLRADPMKWPIFNQTSNGQNNEYWLGILISELYENFDDNLNVLSDTVPFTDGKLIINNEASELPYTEEDLSMFNLSRDTCKYIWYPFRIGEPNFLYNSSIPDYSYTRKIEVSVQKLNGDIVPWLPISGPDIPIGGDGVQRVYVLGGVVPSSNFITGPEVPEYVLRDPPGSQSSATRSAGTSKSEVKSWSWNLGGAIQVSDDVYTGADFEVGFGTTVATEVFNNISVGFETSINGGRAGSLNFSTSNTEDWSTSGSTSFVGSPGDLYVGRSQNLEVGVAEILSIVPEDLGNIEFIDNSSISDIGDLRFAKRYTLSIEPEGYETQFIYTEKFIENVLIPNIEEIRNIMLQTNGKYTSHLPVDDPLYALNNDDVLFGAQASSCSGSVINSLTGFASGDCAELLTGPSYTYAATDDTDVDSVRMFNEQINQWKEAIALNEWEKINIDNQDVIDSLKQVELDALDEEYSGSLAAFATLTAVTAVAAVVTTGVTAAAAFTPGGAIAGNIGFLVTTGASIASHEVSQNYLEYSAKKNRIEERFANVGAKNFSVDAGASVTSTTTQVAATSITNSLNYGMTTELAGKIGGKINGNGVGFERSLKFNYSSSNNWGSDSTTTESVSFTLQDEDAFNFFSVDVYPSLLGWGPIFKRRAGGQTSCPYEGEVLSKYYEPGTIISEGTLQMDKPSLSISPSNQTNIPADQPAVYNLTVGNETESDRIRAYTVEVNSSTNPFGAIVRIDGLSSTELSIPAGTALNKVLTIEKGPGAVYQYDSIEVKVYPACQPLLFESVFVSATFLPVCTDVNLIRPEELWVVNSFNTDTLPIAISDYNINHFDLRRLRLDYKPSNSPNWIGVESFWKDTTGFNDPSAMMIPTSTPFIQYDWNVKDLADGDYDIRVLSECREAPDVVREFSNIHIGYMDRINPHAFGSPSPADGILDPNDDILLTMNEPVDIGSITSLNFDVRGVLNGSELRHETSLSFDGINSYAEIPEYQLQKRSLTIEFWAKRNGSGEGAVVSQGLSSTDELSIYFNAGGNLVFKLGDKALTSSITADDKWHHYAVVYDRTNLNAEIFIDFSLDVSNNSFGTDYNSTGPVFIAKHSTGAISNYDGQIHELRFWSIPRTEAQIAVKGNVNLSGRESGLIGNWPMSEGYATVAFDKVRSRHAQLMNTSWAILPQNHAFTFNGSSDYLESLAGDLGFNDETDLTIEAWFKTGSSTGQSIFSNGKADGTRPEDFAWNLYLDGSGAVILENDGNSITSNDGLNDDNWHHVSVVVERTRSVSLYIDGELISTGNASDFKGFAGPKLWVGCRGWFEANTEIRDSYFDGLVDEIRIWNVARKSEQVARDFLHQLNGDELGLQVYYPFDGVRLNDGVYLRNPVRDDLSPNNYNLQLGSGVVDAYSVDAPPVKLPRLIEKVNFTYSINDDQIFIDITDPPARVENVTLDITVDDLEDLAGNIMQSPETWIAYVDKNQVFWDTEYFKFEKKLEDQLSFTAKIKNTGGSQERFSLSNLPSWLTATPSSGLIDPNSTIEVEFKVQPLLNIGEYEQDIFVSTESFGFNERLLLDLKVTVDPPVWEVDADAFDQSMNITGELFINDVISTDPEDMVSVWVNDELRGVSHVEFDPTSGKNLVFLTVLSNVSSGETLEFRAWDASRGRLLKGLMPDDIAFIGGGVINNRTNPLPIKATVLTQLNYVLNEGWNWISFPLDHPDLSSVNTVLKELSPTENDQMKSQDQGVAQSFFYSGGSWVANDTSVNTNLGYKIKVAKADTFRYEGTFVDPSTQPIDVVDGWNWIGVKSEFIIDVPSAMASLDPQTGDVIKGQRSFAIYEDGFGWGGNLDFLQPQQGYMLQYHKTDQLTFPGNLNARSKPETQLKSRSHKGKEYARLEKSLNYVSGKYSNTMSLIAAVDDCILLDTEGVLQLSQWSLVAHAGDECRGVVESTWIESIGEYRYYLSIEGNSSVPLTFKLVHNSNGKEIILNQGMNFETNGVVGMNSSPYLFSCVAPSDCINTMLYQNADIDMSQTDITRQVLTELQSNALLPTGRVFRFKAGQSIEFMGEFEVTRGAILEAYIEECIKGNE